MIDVNVLLGAYPWRRVPGTSPEAVRATMDRMGIAEAWATHLPGLFWRDPAEGNEWLYRTCEATPGFHPVPAVHPGLPGWEQDLERARAAGAPAVRCDPGCFGLAPTGPEMRRLVEAAGSLGVPLQTAVRLEDGRGRHPNDIAAELPAAAVRAWVRWHPDTRLVVLQADRAFIEEVHFGSTAADAARIWWDIAWLWGPPEDHLAAVLASIGVGRFLFGSGQPLRIPETPVARLDLLSLSSEGRRAIERDNALQLSPRRTPAS